MILFWLKDKQVKANDGDGKFQNYGLQIVISLNAPHAIVWTTLNYGTEICFGRYQLKVIPSAAFNHLSRIAGDMPHS